MQSKESGLCDLPKSYNFDPTTPTSPQSAMVTLSVVLPCKSDGNDSRQQGLNRRETVVSVKLVIDSKGIQGNYGKFRDCSASWSIRSGQRCEGYVLTFLVP